MGWVVLSEKGEEVFATREAAKVRADEINDGYGIDADGEGYCNAIVMFRADEVIRAERKATRTEKYLYRGFGFATLAEAEAARKDDHGGWIDGRRACIWTPEGKAV